MAQYHVGDEVRVLQVPPYLYSDDPLNHETAAIFEKSLNGVYRVMDFDEHGQLELWLTSEGKPLYDYAEDWNGIWIEPEHVEMVRAYKPADA